MRERQLLDTARLLGFGEGRIRRLEEILARAKSVDEAITEFRKLQEEPNGPLRKNSVKIVKGDQALIEHIEKGWILRRSPAAISHYLKTDERMGRKIFPLE